ncbi:phage terminase small subunit P27 family [Dongia sp.]|uniref:phage terminase small subunit P27 family n=1 Tax=Dongia sp. TaxID=1977262 RepID=UPI0035B3865F
MVRGRKPDTASRQEAKGNPGKRKKSIEAAGAVQIDSTPAHLKPPKGLSEAGLALWREILPDATRMNFLKPTDRHAFARYCQMLARYWEAEKAIGKSGSVRLVKTVSGDKMQRISPWVAIRDRLEVRLIALEDRLGFSPQARQSYLRNLIAGAGGTQPDLPLGGEQRPPEPENTENPIGILGSLH